MASLASAVVTDVPSVFAKAQAIRKMVWMAGTAPGINGIEIEIARRFVSRWKSSRDKFRQRFAERIERQPHSARSRDRWYVASWWEFEAYRLWSGRIEARIGLRMMPTFPRSPLSFRTASFPQYGWKAGLSDGAFPK